MNKKRTLWLLAIIVTLTMLAGAACGGDGDGGGDPTDSPDATEPSPSGDVPGVTDTEIILGTHTPLTGPVSVYSAIANATNVYFEYINDTEGGVFGRKIVYLQEDDQYSPSLTVDLVKKLVEQDGVFAIVNGLGTPTHQQVVDYLQDAGVPDLFVATGATEWTKDPAARPTVFGSIANYIAEGTALGRHIAETFPGMSLGIIFQNDDFGLDGMEGLERGIGDALEIVGRESYEVTDPDLNSQVDSLSAAGADVIAAWVTPLLMSTAIKHARLDLDWDVPFVISGVSANELTIILTGEEEIEGTVSQVALHQSYEADHPGIIKHKEIWGDPDTISQLTLYGQFIGELVVETLKLAGENPTRESLVEAAESLSDFVCSVCLFPANMSDTDHDPAETVILARVENGQWVPFGDGISWEGILSGDLNLDSLTSVPSPYQ